MSIRPQPTTPLQFLHEIYLCMSIDCNLLLYIIIQNKKAKQTYLNRSVNNIEHKHKIKNLNTKQQSNV